MVLFYSIELTTLGNALSRRKHRLPLRTVSKPLKAEIIPAKCEPSWIFKDTIKRIRAA